ncbi:DNA topoisomerase I [Cryptosporidium ubiquitum]|uniref:DNA topoisomerase 1 n=1 Tax=Cryptosporidium ubiquitum TaxID=857276 RepID=A0A1J4MKS9_9CRYT|nr:DNA topoisomerase I [Cryptosporidium ubiquitum]OII74874.1 DNA topoisomerase I [Cryptosporidium ubiquitum]
MASSKDLLLGSTNKRRKVMKKTEMDYEPLNKWWERPPKEELGVQWEYLEHQGVMFAPPYKVHNKPLIYNGERIQLPPEAEEIASYWSVMKDTEWAQKEKFSNNVRKAFMSSIPVGDKLHNNLEWEKCNFDVIKQYFEDEKEAKKNLSKEEKELQKKYRGDQESLFVYALVDWIKEKVGNFRIEPPGLFKGRGEHPKSGMLKRRIFPEDVTLNIAEDAPVPKVPNSMKGHAWKDIFHDNTVTWLAYYRDSINNQFKYIFLSASSGFKGMSDYNKYEKARKLKDYIDAIRDDYRKKMISGDITQRQLGTATYLIDFLALRVGGEKDTDEEADTVGCCSLRVEHITFNKQEKSITLDFLGKDSIRYYNTVVIDPAAFNNLTIFCKNKDKMENVFDQINMSSLNQYLKSIMPELSAKVFRTFNASITLERELSKISAKPTMKSEKKTKMELEGCSKEEIKISNFNNEVDITNVNDILRFYNDANREVAILCNHQRSVPKQHESSMEKMVKQQQELEEDLKICETFLKILKKNKSVTMNELPKLSIETSFNGKQRKYPINLNSSPDVVQKKIDSIKSKISNLYLKIKIKDDNKTVALNTSKINYMDPRISVAFCKKYDLPIDKIFNRSLRTKFPWAMYTRSDFSF